MPDVLSREIEEFIEQQIASGKFRSRREILEEALRQFRARERKLDALRAELQAGLEQLECGEALVINDQAEHEAFVKAIKKRGRELLHDRNEPE